MIRYFLLFPIYLFLLSACHKGASRSPLNNLTDTSKFNVYVSGTYWTDTSVQACYWKNDSLILLPGWTGSTSAAIAVSGNDVYVGGQAYGPAYWKNGTFFQLSQGYNDDEVTGMVVSNGTLYLCGNGINTNGQPVSWYWSNNQFTDIADTNQNGAFGIATSGSDVYVAGFITTFNPTKYYATLWKNGNVTYLTDGTINAIASGITISGTDVYVCGTQYTADGNGIATYWKNGSPVMISDSTALNSPKAIFVSGSDVYVSGTTQHTMNGSPTGNLIAGYWKNGSFIQLSDGTTNCYNNNLALAGDSIYMSYSVAPNNKSIPAYFKDTATVTLYLGPNTRASTSGIVVVPKN